MDKIGKDNSAQEPSKIRSQQEQQLIQLDKKIEDLKNLYTLFFSGELKLPPEKEREELQKAVRLFSQSESRSPRINMLMQNLIAKFTLYNNLWMKKMNDLEIGSAPSLGKSKAAAHAAPTPEKSSSRAIAVNLNSEASFENFYKVYCQITTTNSETGEEKEKVINMIKSKLIFNNIVEGKVEMSMAKGKLSLKIKNNE